MSCDIKGAFYSNNLFQQYFQSFCSSFFHRAKGNLLRNIVNTWPLRNKFKPSSWKDLTWRGSREQSQDNVWFLQDPAWSYLRNSFSGLVPMFLRSRSPGKGKIEGLRQNNFKLYLLRASVQITSCSVNWTYLADMGNDRDWRHHKLCWTPLIAKRKTIARGTEIEKSWSLIPRLCFLKKLRNLKQENYTEKAAFLIKSFLSSVLLMSS